MRPLTGIRVVDLTHALAGPFCTHQLQMLGADVVKVEPPGHGDDFRVRPSVFRAINAGKRSITLNLKLPAGREVLHRLVRSADVLVENYRPGVGPKLGVEWEALSAINPRLIFCSITGFGQTGSLRDFPAIEWSVQAMSGMTVSYMPDELDGRRLGLGVLDPFSGYVGHASILAALLERQRTGLGRRLDVAMLDAALALMSGAVSTLQAGGRDETRQLRPTMARFKANDRSLFIGALHDRWFESLCQILGAPELVSDPRFADGRSRQEHGDALTAELRGLVATRPAAKLERELTAAGLPASVVRTLAEIVAHPHVREREILEEVPSGDGASTMRLVARPYRTEQEGPIFQGPVPELGQHTDEVLAGLGYAPEAIDQLRAARAI